jgi:Kef-type K+ transport system membrane component KefB
MASPSETSLPYHEPDIVTILVLASFLLLSNLVNYALNRILYCGLIGQILIGIAWGTPGAKWLDKTAETAMVQLGYLGLILLVYEGAKSTTLLG